MAIARKALIIGGGIIGVTSAYALARNGWAVTIVESEPQVARGASLGNGRQLSYSHTNALASPALLPQMPSLLLGHDDAFRINLRPSLPFAMWLMRFLGNCTRRAFRANTLACLQLAQESRAAMDDLLDQHPIAFNQRKAGKLVLLRCEQELLAAEASTQLRQSAGAELELVSPEQACEIEPALAHGPEQLAGAIYSPADETGDCSHFAAELLDLLQRSYGVTFLGGNSVNRIARQAQGWRVQHEDGSELESDHVLLTTGHQANHLLAPLGLAQPIQSMKGYSFTAPIGIAAPALSITDNARRIVFTNLGEHMLIAGIADMGDASKQVDPQRLAVMRRAAQASLPYAADYDAVDEGWAGHRPMTPDSLPIIKQLAPGLFANLGHGMLGWTLAMGSAERLARLLGRPT
ncbi:MAG: FAD-dependent oxidoreductase [Sphingomonadaceae bacterium]|nr:FAD-dependent oxidoreductase [Sphingomonadaceae bacterium]